MKIEHITFEGAGRDEEPTGLGGFRWGPGSWALLALWLAVLAAEFAYVVIYQFAALS